MDALEQKVNHESLINIIKAIGNRNNINEIKKEIVTQVGKAFDADRCFIRFFDNELDEFLPVDEYSEYLSSKSLASAVNYNFNDEFNKCVNPEYKKGNCFIIPDIDIFEKSLGKDNIVVRTVIDKFNAKSNYCCPIFTDNELSGTLIVHYTKRKIFLDEKDVELLKTITAQSGVLIKQARLYEKEKNLAKREAFLREVMISAMEASDLEQALNTIVTKTGEFLKADRCFYVEFDFNIDAFKPAEKHAEYNRFPDIKKMSERPFTKEESEPFAEFAIRQKKSLAVNNIYESGLSKAGIAVLEEYAIKSFVLFPVFYQNIPLGMLAVNSVKNYRNFTQEEMDLLSVVVSQSSLIIYQKKLYLSTKQQSEREKTMSEIISAMMGAVEIDELKTKIVNNVGKALQADRCSIIQYDNESRKFLVVDEYVNPLYKDKFISQKGLSLEQNEFNIFKELFLKNKQELLIYDIDNPDKDIDPQMINILKAYKIKSNYTVLITYGEKFYGILYVNYINSKRELVEEELDFFRNLANQAGIAIYNALLLEDEKQNAHRETLLRTITEIVRSKLDINEIKKRLVTQIGQAFKADKCLIRFYDNINEKFMPIDEYSGYYSSPDLKKEYSLGEDGDKYILEEYKKGKMFLIPDIEALLGEPGVLGKMAKKQIEHYGIKTNYCFPIFLEDQFFGVFIIQYKEKTFVSDKDFELLRNIVDQAKIGLIQSELYANSKKQLEKETLLRNITEIIRNSMDINTVKKNIVNQIGKTLNVDRCVLHQVNPETNKFMPIDIYSEYKTDENIKSYVGINIENEELTYFREMYLSKQEMIAADWKAYLEEIPEKYLESNIKKGLIALNIKSNYAFPVTYLDNLIGMIYITFDKEQRILSSAELEMIRSLINQVGITLNQVLLYEKEKQSSKQDKFLRELTVLLKANLNTNEILSVCIDKLYKYYNAEVVQIEYFNQTKNTIKKISETSKKTNDSLLFLNSEEIYSSILNNNILTANAYNKEKLFSELKEGFPDLKIKSLIKIPVSVEKNKIYNIFIALSEAKDFNISEVEFLKSLQTLFYIAIRDTNLYNQSQFVSNLSHELKTPISIIKIYSEFLLDLKNEIGQKSFSFVEKIDSNVDKLNEMINNLLYLSRIEKKADAQDIKFEEEDINEVINSAIKECAYLFKQKNIKANLNLKESPRVCINKSLMHQALYNLIENAVKFSSSNSEIYIETKVENDFLHIIVKDNGIGMKKTDMDNIFKPFFRTKNAQENSIKGTGLGLSIVKLIIEKHNGNIFVDSKVNKGTIFSIQLKIAPCSKIQH